MAATECCNFPLTIALLTIFKILFILIGKTAAWPYFPSLGNKSR
jgi:hypothetical protein